jgi:hypothetical protein
MKSIIPTHMSHPISRTDSELAAHNLTKIHLDSPYPDQLERKYLWTVFNQTTGTKPIWPVLNLNMGGNPHGQSLDLDILCPTYIESMGLKLTFYGDFILNHNSLFQSLNRNLQAKIFSVQQ